MVLDAVLLAAGALALLVAAAFAHLERWSITPPLLGLLVGVALGPQLLGAIDLHTAAEIDVLHVGSRLLLAVALMAAALRYPLEELRRRASELVLLLAIVLPVMAGVVAAGAAWALHLPLGLALVLGATLSPTDPVLTSGIVTGAEAERDIPERGRQVLTLESGANDGLALPLVVLAIAVALRHPLPSELGRLLYETAAAVLVGVLAGTAAGRALRWAEEHRELGPAVRSLYTLVLAALVLGLGGLFQVADLLAVFVAGLAHNRLVTAGDREMEVAVDETLNQFLVIPIFVILGSALPWRDWAELGWGGALFVTIALLVRRWPVVLALRRPVRATWAHVGWLGWFGPIGIGALFYLGHAAEHGVDDPRLWAAGTLVIVVSTVVHGLSSAPARLAYRRITARSTRA